MFPRVVDTAVVCCYRSPFNTECGTSRDAKRSVEFDGNVSGSDPRAVKWERVALVQIGGRPRNWG